MYEPSSGRLDRALLGLARRVLAVMRAGSLSGASRALGVAQPTVRRQIEKLEEVLGAVLFTRSQTGLIADRDGRRHAALRRVDGQRG